MTTDELKTRRLVGLFLLGCALFNYPILSLFNLPVSISGIPLLFAYVFVTWALLIVFIFLVTKFTYRPPFGDLSDR
jgi:hypothetical protein